MAPSKANKNSKVASDSDKNSNNKGSKNKGKPNNSSNGKDGDDRAAAGSAKLKPATAINVRHILCEKASKKDEAASALSSGRSFADVARDFSEDKARQGGALGWRARNTLLLEFEKVAYALEVSSSGAPRWGEVKTSEGWHLVMVEGRR